MSFTRDCLHRFLALLGRPAALLLRAEALARHDAYGSATALFGRAARSGLPEARYRLGHCYLLGQGVPISVTEAIRWLTLAAEGGHPAAQTKLASLALCGVTDDGSVNLFSSLRATPSDPDYTRAERWSRCAAASGSAEAKALLGLILTAGPLHLRDVAAGEAYYRESAEAGWFLGQYGLAIKLLQKGTPDTAGQARILLADAATAGIPMAHYILGELAESGMAGETDERAAVTSYRAAAELGYPPAQLRYGQAVLTGRGTHPDRFAGENWLRRAALAGEAEAAAILGNLYLRADDGPANHPEAAIWFTRAAEAGHAASARMLGWLLLHGEGIGTDTREAARWLCLAVENGDDEACNELAPLALTRRVGESEQHACFTRFRHLAEAGVPAAQFNLGICLVEGIGTAADDVAALDWFRRAQPAMPAAHFWIQSLLAKGCGRPAVQAVQPSSQISAG